MRVRTLAVIGALALATGCGGSTSASSVVLAEPPATASASGPTQAVLFVGDSFTAGTGASSPGGGEACLTAYALGLGCLLDAEGATGYLADGHEFSSLFTPLVGRLAADHARFRPSYLVVDAGRDDGAFSTAELDAAAATYLARLHATFPAARVAVVVPYFLTETRDGRPDLAAFLRAHAAGLGLAGVIDPFTAGWIGPSTTGRLLAADGIHPSPAGHAYLAAHLAPALRALGF